MSSWGPKPFDNDSALDWFAEVTTRGAAEVCRVLEIVADADPDEYVDVDDASVAIAAATIVAACSGSPDARLPHAVHAWVQANAAAFGPHDLDLACRAVERVHLGPSEVLELWDTDPKWREEIRNLVARLGPRRSTGRPPSPTGVPHAHLKQALLTFLGARGLEATEAQRARIWASQDLAEIQRWLAHVVETSSVTALLDE